MKHGLMAVNGNDFLTGGQNMCIMLCGNLSCVGICQGSLKTLYNLHNESKNLMNAGNSWNKLAPCTSRIISAWVIDNLLFMTKMYFSKDVNNCKLHISENIICRIT